MGKWSNLKGKIDPFAQEPEYQQRVEEVKSQYLELSAPEIARIFGTMRTSKLAQEVLLKNMNVELEALSQLFCTHAEANGLTKIGLDSGATCYVQIEPYTQVENRDECISYLKKHKMQAMLVPQWQTLNAANKERLQQGQAPIPGTKCYLKTSARIRGANDGE